MSVKLFVWPPVPVNTTGLATEAKQDVQIGLATTANTTLASIDSKLTSPVPVTGPLTDVQLRAAAVPVLGPLTDTELRASAVPVSGPLTDTELRATAVPVSVAALPLPTGAATDTLQTAGNASLSSIDTKTGKNQMDVGFQLDAGLFNAASTNIPASSSAPVQVVASTGAAVKKILIVDDIGEFIGIYVGAPSSEVLEAITPLGGGEIELQIPAGVRISIKHMKNSAITSGFLAINFLT